MAIVCDLFDVCFKEIKLESIKQTAVFGFSNCRLTENEEILRRAIDTQKKKDADFS